MTSAALLFIAFALFSLLCFVGGYAARIRGWVHEDASRKLHLVTLIGPWSWTVLLSLWQSPPGSQAAMLLLIEPMVVIIPTLGMAWVASRLGFSKKQVGVLAIAAGLSNVGFTQMGFLSYTLLSDPAMLPPWVSLAPGQSAEQATADAALAYAITQVTIMSVLGILVMYPIALRFGGQAGPGVSVGRLIVMSLIDIRAIQLYAAAVGLTLGWSGVAVPRFVSQFYMLEILMFLGAFGAYVGIGMRLHVGHSLKQIKAHSLLAVFQFVVAPVLMVGILLVLASVGQRQPILAEHVLVISGFAASAIQMVMIANLFHLDTRLASGLWLVNTLISLAIPVPIIILLL